MEHAPPNPQVHLLAYAQFLPQYLILQWVYVLCFEAHLCKSSWLFHHSSPPLHSSLIASFSHSLIHVILISKRPLPIYLYFFFFNVLLIFSCSLRIFFL